MKVKFKRDWLAYRIGDETEQLELGSVDLLLRRGFVEPVEDKPALKTEKKQTKNKMVSKVASK